MLTAKRVLIATICGFIFGLICMTLASTSPNTAEPLSCEARVMIILSRTLLGFMIGISALRMSWWLHGIVLGIISSIPMAIPMLDNLGIAIGTVVMGIIYGFLTELITSVLFKSKPVGLLTSAS